jgi:predicted XRE-type DNA-binding protein
VQAAYYFGEAKVRISNLSNGELSRFSVDKIIILLAQAGRLVHVQVTPRQRVDLYYVCGSRVKL